MTVSLETAKTEFLDASVGRFAFRRIGPDAGAPLVCMQHFTGTMDSWDPAVVNGLAQTRPVVVFDNLGVGASSGETPDSVEQMAADAAAFISALGHAEVDLLGFSLGGMLAQVLAARRLAPIRRIVIAGAAPRGGEEHLLDVVQEAFAKEAADVRLPLFFTPSEASQAAGRAFVARAAARVADRDADRGEEVSGPQAKAIIGWCAAPDEGEETLRAIAQPVLVAHGSDDTMFPSVNAYRMFKATRNAQLILYPDSGHGALFQYAGLFVAHCRLFLDN